MKIKVEVYLDIVDNLTDLNMLEEEIRSELDMGVLGMEDVVEYIKLQELKLEKTNLY